MFERFGQDVRGKVRRAAELAEAEGAALLEVQHLLLALVDPATGRVGRALEEVGINRHRVQDARDREFRSALAVAGVVTGRSAPVGSARLRRGRSTRFAPSAKLALERTLEVACLRGDRSINSEHLLTAIVSAKVGIVPRLLVELDIGPDDLVLAIQDRS